MTKLFDDATRCVHRPPVKLEGFDSLSVPVYRASTIAFEDAQSFRDRGSREPDGYSYGLAGTPTTRALEGQLSDLAGGVRSVLVPSGQAAIAILMLAVLTSGDHVLIPDNVYPPVRQFAREVLEVNGVEVTLYDPMELGTLTESVRPGRTKLVWIEAPGSTSMEVCDIPVIAAIAKECGAIVGCDNTWATSLFCKPLTLGVDVVAEALTKYAGGHSDVLLGALNFASMTLYERVRSQLGNLGVGASPADCSLVLRGMETMSVRLAHVRPVALQFAERMRAHKAIARVLHPALLDSPGHLHWKRHFRGSSGVFSVKLSPAQTSAIDRALDSLQLFTIGASWGGTRSLIAPISLDGSRIDNSPHAGATYLRFSIGVESPEDLWRDVERMLSILGDD